MKLRERQTDGHGYWKMKVMSIHRDKRRKYWVIGLWFYSPSELSTVGLTGRHVSPISNIFPNLISGRERDLIPLMGNTELVASDHKDVIDAACIEGRCRRLK